MTLRRPFSNKFSLFYPGIVVGLISGIVLGLFFKAVQRVTDIGVYTLLLNVDFMPGFHANLPEWLEFAMHMAVSLCIGIVYIVWLNTSPYPWRNAILLALASSLLFIPLTLLSDVVPQIDDASAIIWWVIGHLLYGIVLGWLGSRFRVSF
ncbi:hypothetical protein J2T13_004350 [Paenibacillus sp. DS2015]|uniref:hypothetical protein n=1 Tax=Paenibacillus sp. DS2015 TaxID=3373917 RepID=UPI003D259174